MKKYEVTKNNAGYGKREYFAKSNDNFIQQFLGKEANRYKITLPEKFKSVSYGRIELINYTAGHDAVYNVTIYKKGS